MAADAVQSCRRDGHQDRLHPLPQEGRPAAAPAHGRHYRACEPAHLDRLRFIRRCRDLGFTLDPVRDPLRLSSEEDQDCAEVDRIAAQHLTAVERKIADLARPADELRRITTICLGGGRVADCRIVEALSPEGER